MIAFSIHVHAMYGGVRREEGLESQADFPCTVGMRADFLKSRGPVIISRYDHCLRCTSDDGSVEHRSYLSVFKLIESLAAPNSTK